MQQIDSFPPLTRLSQDETLFRDSVYEFADREIRPLVREMDEHAKIPPPLLASLFDLEADPSEAALHETAEAIGLVQASGNPMELAPQNAYVRRLQHQMAERNNLMSRSRGTEPNRRVELLPDEGRAWR